MIFSQVIEDIKKLVGLELSSIRPGASITILEVDCEKGCLLLRTNQGKTRSRPLSELQVIWDELNRSPAVHVEGVLHGSGTSRNQPETIFANLPYIEWLKVNNKKHIAFVGKNSHVFGTLRQMDSLDAAEISRRIQFNSVDTSPQVVIVSDDVSDTINKLSTTLPGSVSTLENGIYSYESTTIRIIIVISNHTDLVPGSYLVIPQVATTAKRHVTIGNDEYHVISESKEVKFLTHK